MNKKTAIVLAFTLLLPLATEAQSAVPLPACCPRIYDAGRWLGWASAMLEYARDIGGPTPAQEDIVNCLRSAGESAEAAYRACSSGVPAWEDWKQSQLWLEAQIAELRHPGNSTKQRWMRWELVASAIATAYEQWADALSWEKVNGQKFKRKTCAACFFQLGFDLAGATQAFRQAFAANADRSLSTTKRLQATLRELNRTRLRLKKSLVVLDAYEAAKRRNPGVSGCPAFGEDDLEMRIRAIALTAPSMTRASEEMRFVSERSNDVGRLLAENCVAGGQGAAPAAAGPTRPPASTSPGRGQVFIGKYVRLISLRFSQGYQLNVPVLVIERTGRRTYRILRYFDREVRFDQGRASTSPFSWHDAGEGSQYEVFGGWACQTYASLAGGKISVNSRRWLPRVLDDQVPRLREARVGVADWLLPPDSDWYNNAVEPSHCAGDDTDCNGDITGNWVDNLGWCLRFEPKLE